MSEPAYDAELYEELLQKAMGALADIALSPDLTESQRRHKARRIYWEIRKVLEGLEGERGT